MQPTPQRHVGHAAVPATHLRRVEIDWGGRYGVGRNNVPNVAGHNVRSRGGVVRPLYDEFDRGANETKRRID